MKIKYMTIEEILEKEKDIVMNAESRYGAYFQNTANFDVFLSRFISGVKPEASLFLIFLSQIQKHHRLALFSTVRLHHIQAMQNLRQVLESGVNATYAIQNPNEEDFVVMTPDGILDAPKELQKKRYKWLKKHFKDKSQFIKNMKDSINKSCAHSNLIYAMQNFQMHEGGDGFNLTFFDFEKDFFVKANLWTIGNIALGLMDLFYGANRKNHVITFVDDFSKQLHKLEEENHRLKSELEQHKLIDNLL